LAVVVAGPAGRAISCSGDAKKQQQVLVRVIEIEKY
jgi:hypothetical protein